MVTETSHDIERVMLNGARDLILLIDRQGVVVHANASVYSLLDCGRDDVIGRHIEMLITEPNRPVLNAYLMEVAATGVGQGPARGYLEIDAITKTGRTVAMEISINGVDDSSIGQFVAVMHDITARRAAEFAAKMRDHRSEQHQRMEVIGRLSGGIAHEFNNVMAILIGCLDIVAEQLPEHATVQTHINRMIETAQRGADLTQVLLTISRRKILRPELLDIAVFAKRAQNLITLLLDAEHELIVRVPSRPTWLCNVDPTLLQAALVELVQNARDAMRVGDTLQISIKNESLTEKYGAQGEPVAPQEYVAIEVRDNGVGMNVDAVERALEPFYTSKSTVAAKGLGLSMVNGFVTQSGGFLRIESAVDKGTSITLYFPRASVGLTVAASSAHGHVN